MPRSVAENAPVAHDTLFDVYRLTADNQRTFAFGLAAKDDAVLIDHCGDDVTVQKVSLVKGIRILSQRVKSGYARDPSPMFFNERRRVFTFGHPDLEWSGAQWLLAATPADLVAGAEAVANMVRQTPADVIMGVEIDAWLQQQRRNFTYLVAFDDHPIWSLALAQAALDKGWSLRAASDASSLPDAPPASQPVGWREWLSPRFKRAGSVEAAQAGLRWTPEAFLTPAKTSDTSQSLAALL